MVEQNFSGVWTPESLRYLKANCQLSAEEMRDILTERFEIQPALQTVRNEMSKARKEARLESEAMAAAVDMEIQRRILENCNDYWEILDGVIRREARILDGDDPEYKCCWKDGSPSLREWRSTAKSLGEHIQIAFAIRPEPKEFSVKLEDGESIEERMAKYAALFEKKTDAASEN